MLRLGFIDAGTVGTALAVRLSSKGYRVVAISSRSQASAKNLAQTGPIARGDTGTIKKHLEALQKTSPELLPTYRELGRQTIPIAQAKGRINQHQAQELEAILKQPD